MVNGSEVRSISSPSLFHVYPNGDSLLDIKNVFIFCTISGMLFFLTIAMQIKDVDIVEIMQQALAHTPESGIIKVTMIGDKGKNAIARSLDTPLCEANKLNIVIT